MSFETAMEVFADPNQAIVDDDFADDEQRYQIIGFTSSLVLLLVVFVDRSTLNREVIRIISARKAEEYEIRIYRAQNQNH